MTPLENVIYNPVILALIYQHQAPISSGGFFTLYTKYTSNLSLYLLYKQGILSSIIISTVILYNDGYYNIICSKFFVLRNKLIHAYFNQTI